MALRKTYFVDFLLITVVLVWGFNFALMKVLYRYFHPIAFNAIRFVISSTTMLSVLKLRREPIGIDANDARRIIWLGLLANTLVLHLGVRDQRDRCGAYLGIQ